LIPGTLTGAKETYADFAMAGSMSNLKNSPISDPTNTFNLTSEQQDTANLLERLLGKTLSDRYVDFCRLSSGAFDLRVVSPLAGHALRELESILRQIFART
jgi:hypothetical protein